MKSIANSTMFKPKIWLTIKFASMHIVFSHHSKQVLNDFCVILCKKQVLEVNNSKIILKLACSKIEGLLELNYPLTNKLITKNGYAFFKWMLDNFLTFYFRLPKLNHIYIAKYSTNCSTCTFFILSSNEIKKCKL